MYKFLAVGLLFLLIHCKSKEPVPQIAPVVTIPEVYYKIFWEDSCKYIKVYHSHVNDLNFSVIHANDCPAFNHILKTKK